MRAKICSDRRPATRTASPDSPEFAAFDDALLLQPASTFARSNSACTFRFEVIVGAKSKQRSARDPNCAFVSERSPAIVVVDVQNLS